MDTKKDDAVAPEEDDAAFTEEQLESMRCQYQIVQGRPCVELPVKSPSEVAAAYQKAMGRPKEP